MGVIKATVATLKNLIPPKLTDDDPLQEDLWNKAVDALSNCATALEEVDKRITPIGMIYIQLPGRSLPTSMWPGTSWSDISGSFAGGFFRAKGGDAENTGTRQADAFQGHRLSIFTVNCWANIGITDGVASNNHNTQIAQYTTPTRQYWSSDGINGNPRTDKETRPVNYAVTIWQCAAV